MVVKRLTTKEALIESLVELSERKSFEKITVEEIAKNCGVSKRTFYNHFADKFELATYVYAHNLRESLRASTQTRSFYDFELFCIDQYVRLAEYTANAIRNTHGLDSVQDSMVAATEELFFRLIERRDDPVPIDDELRFQVTYASWGLISSFLRWNDEGRRASRESLARWCTNSIPENLGRAMGFTEWWDGLHKDC